MELQWCPYKTQIQDFTETLLGPTEALFRMSSKRNHKSKCSQAVIVKRTNMLIALKIQSLETVRLLLWKLLQATDTI